jgi:hypothetical protein
MADKSFGVKEIELIGASGTPTIESPNNLDIKAVNVAISTDITVGGMVSLGAGTSISSPGTNVLTFGTNSTEKVRIDSSGNFGIGTDNPKAQTWRNGTTLDVYGGSGSVVGNLHIGANRGDGNQTVGSIVFYDNTQDTNHKVISIIESDKTGSTSNQRGGTVKVYVKEDATVSNSSVESATFTANGISFPSGKGIDFSAAGNASGMTSELLDDYEEGSWTPGILRSTVNPTVSLTSAGKYTKIGNQVFIYFDMSITTLSGGSGRYYIYGLPFSTSTQTNNGGYGAPQFRDCTAFPLAAQQIPSAYHSTTTIQLRYMSGATTESDISVTTGRITGWSVYFTS